MELSDAMNDVLTEKWVNLRGLSVVSVAINSITAPKEDEDMIKQLQRNAVMRDPTMAAATLVGAQAQAMQDAAKNEAGAMTGFIGMGMAMNAGGGMNAQNLFATGQQQAPQQAPVQNGWSCSCGNTVSGNFCPECGTKNLNLNLREIAGNALAVQLLTENSVLNAVHQNLLMKVGLVPAVR